MKTIRKKFMLFTCIQVTVAVFTMLIISYMYFHNTLIDRYKASSYQTLDQVTNSIDSYFNDVNNMSIAFHYIKDIKDYFLYKSESSTEYETIENRMRAYLNAIIDMKDGLDGIYLLKDGESKSVGEMDENQYTVYKYIHSIDWSSKINGTDYLVLMHNKGDSHIPVISFVRRYLNINLKNKYLGICVIDIKLNAIENILDNIKTANSGQIYIIDKNGNLVNCSDRSLIGSPFKDRSILNNIGNRTKGDFTIGTGSKKQLVSFKECSSANWMIISIMPWDYLMKNVYAMRNFIFIVGIVLACMGMLIVSIFSLKITNPLKHLRMQMDKVKCGNLDDIKFQAFPDDEIGQLSLDFLKMIDNIKELISQIKTEQAKKRIAEFKALQSQINPHFLYNTLDSIIWMVAANRSEESMQMVSSLARMLRISLNDGKEFVTVKKELEHIESYVIIQKMRYGPKLNVELNIQQDILGYTMPKLLLQPIVENSIYHGIKLKKGDGHIRIVGYKKHGMIVFKITDDGVGMSKDKLSEIMNTSQEDSGNYGVANINERVKLQYGQEFGLRYFSKLGKGTMTILTLPLEEEVENKDA